MHLNIFERIKNSQVKLLNTKPINFHAVYKYKQKRFIFILIYYLFEIALRYLCYLLNSRLGRFLFEYALNSESERLHSFN